MFSLRYRATGCLYTVGIWNQITIPDTTKIRQELNTGLLDWKIHAQIIPPLPPRSIFTLSARLQLPCKILKPFHMFKQIAWHSGNSTSNLHVYSNHNCVTCIIFKYLSTHMWEDAGTNLKSDVAPGIVNFTWSPLALLSWYYAIVSAKCPFELPHQYITTVL